MIDQILHLPALREDNPRDFLAALGLLRLVSFQWPDRQVYLSWPEDITGPALHISPALPETWSAELAASLKKITPAPPGPLMHGEIVKTTADSFRAAARTASSFPENSEHPLALLAPLLYAAYSSQNTHPEDGLHISALSFGNGQSGKKLLLDVAQLVAALDPDSISSALLGTAKPVSAKSLRWNPNEFRAAAYRPHDPGKGIKGDDNPDFPAMNVLAFFGLTFFPCIPRISSGSTAGILRRPDGVFFEWPIWKTPLSTDAVASLLTFPADVARPPGITRRWSSRRFSSDKSLYFAPATLID